MTCIVATKCKHGVILAGDSLGAAGWDCEIRRDPKVGKVDKYVFGFTGSYRLGQVLLYDFDPPTPKKGSALDIYRFLVAEFVPALRKKCLAAGILQEKYNIQEFDGGGFIIGIYNHIFYVEQDLQVGWPTQPFTAIGCGAAYALGAMYVSYKAKKRGKDLLMAGLTTAEMFSNGVRSPFVFESNY
jgi:ATP-dependent protease HslVU (ClpYQ) peptidase subunit